MPEPRVVLYDIETSHNLVAKFSLREEYVPHTNIIQERFVICGAWKVLGEKRVHAVSLLDDKARYRKNPHDDYHVVETLCEVLSGADVIVAHNGDKFDWKWLAGRALVQGLPPMPPVPSIDTLKAARRAFCLNSNRLDYLGKLLGFGGKTSTPPGLWIDVLKGDQKAIHTMVDYNKRDVELLEQVFRKLQPFIPDHFNRQLVGAIGCPRCGSNKMQARGEQRSLTQVYQRFQCRDCGGWFRQRRAEKGRATEHRVL